LWLNDIVMIAVIGIGQSLRSDDGAGLAAVRLWQANHSSIDGVSNIRVEMAENPGVGLLTLLEGADSAILVDAVRSGAEPGTLHCLVESQIPAFLDGASFAHGWGVAETLALGRLVNPEDLPVKLVLIGIEAGEVALGEDLSPEVAAALPEVVRLIEKMIKAA
jgi:hydrogenase maturation protease